MTVPGAGLNVYLTSTLPPVGEMVALTGDEARHAVAVRRERPGGRVLVTDGKGAWADCEVVAIGRESLRAVVRAGGDDPPTRPRIAVAQALVKDDRLAVDLLTQAGADQIIPWTAARGVARAGARGGPEGRWGRWASEASKQARRTWHPDIEPVTDLAGVRGYMHNADLSLICHEDADRPAPEVLGGRDTPDSLVIVVGPEGGLTEDEVQQLTAAGGHAVGLGPTVMRSAVAGAMAAAWAAAALGRWGGATRSSLP